MVARVVTLYPVLFVYMHLCIRMQRRRLEADIYNGISECMSLFTIEMCLYDK